MNEAAKEGTKTILSWVPKKLRAIIAVGLILTTVLVGYLIIRAKFLNKSSSSECKSVTLKGILLNKNNNQRLKNVTVQLDNSSSNVESQTTADGSFLLEGVVIPKSQVFSLLVTFTQGQSFLLKNVDVGNDVKYSRDANCVIDLHTIYVSPELSTTNNPSIDKNHGRKTNRVIPSTNSTDNVQSNHPQTSETGAIKISVLPFEYISDNNSFSSLSKGVAESLTNSLSQSDGYIAVEGVQRDNVLKEINFQQGKYVDVSSAVKIGKMLGAQQIVIGSCQIIEGNIILSARVVNVETGTIEKNSITKLSGAIADALQMQSDFANAVVKNLKKN